ncbi:MAG TPA: hypothetical protein VFI73_01075 [Candidatus Nitrosopolaris sp.]|nr:hypothetical protein [Candidatus Nitrosopolaris sp.]
MVLSNHCGNAIQNGRDIDANNIPSPIETMIRSVSQAINRLIQLASTIVSVLVVSDYDDESYLSYDWSHVGLIREYKRGILIVRKNKRKLLYNWIHSFSIHGV